MTIEQFLKNKGIKSNTERITIYQMVRLVNQWQEELDKPNIEFELFEYLYGRPVQMNDRFETVHIWSKEHAIKNRGRWNPMSISKEKYLEEMKHPWNN